MKKVMAFLVLGVICVSLAVSGCEKKSDTEKALDNMKKEANSMLK